MDAMERQRETARLLRERNENYTSAEERFKIYREKELQKMAAQNAPATLGERVLAAVIVTAVVAYVAFLILDVTFKWGLGFVVLGWIGGVLVTFVGLFILVSIWVWVYKGTGHYQHKQKNGGK